MASVITAGWAALLLNLLLPQRLGLVEQGVDHMTARPMLPNAEMVYQRRFGEADLFESVAQDREVPRVERALGQVAAAVGGPGQIADEQGSIHGPQLMERVAEDAPQHLTLPCLLGLGRIILTTETGISRPSDCVRDTCPHSVARPSANRSEMLTASRQRSSRKRSQILRTQAQAKRRQRRSSALPLSRNQSIRICGA